MLKVLGCLMVAFFVLNGCVMVKAKAKPAPPGQVQKATGYNPASGKVKVK